jgi:hypothetical protein
MKVITARQEKIARVNCSCCGADEHFVDILFNKRLDRNDPEDYLFEFEFDTKNDRYQFSTLKRRIQDSFNLLRNKDNFRHDEYIDTILLEPEQVKEIYDVVREYAKKELSKEELAKIDNPEKPEFKKHYIKFKKGEANDWVELFIFRGKDGLTMYIDHFEDKKAPGRVLLHDFGIAWFIPKSTLQKEQKRAKKEEKRKIRIYAWDWLLKRNKTGMRHMYCSLTKSETIRFLSSINYIFTNIVKKAKGELSCIMI